MAFDDKKTETADDARQLTTPQSSSHTPEQKSDEQDTAHKYSDWASI